MKRYTNQNGIYLLAAVALVVLLIIMAAFVIGVGYRSGNRVILQDHANLVALSAMEGFINTPGSYANKKTAALSRANYILSENTLKGINKAAGAGIGILENDSITIADSAGFIEYGNWYEKKPTGAGAIDPCGASAALYPCFIANAAGAAVGDVNAVHVFLRNKMSNPIFARFAGNVGNIAQNSYSVIVPRCTANLVDISYSSALESHPACLGTNCFNEPASVIPPTTHLGTYILGADLVPTSPDLPQGVIALPAFPASVLSVNCLDIISVPDFLATETPPYSFEDKTGAVYWCNLPPTRNTADARFHFRSDYELETLPGGNQMLIDKYVSAGPIVKNGPEPFTRFMTAMNASFRLLQQNNTAGDRAMLLGFSGLIPAIAQIPPAAGAPPVAQLTNNLDYLIQITNINNIGTKTWAAGAYTVGTEIYPNLMNENFTPRYSRIPEVSGTNLINALYQAQTALTNVNQCSTIAKKTILLATDGIGTCQKNVIAQPGWGIDDATTYICSNTYSTYGNQNYALMFGILPMLVDKKISVTILLDGQVLNSNYLNIYAPTISPDNGTDYLTQDEARAFGYGTSPGSPWSPPNNPDSVPTKQFFGWLKSCGSPGPCEWVDAFNQIGTPGTTFGLPARILGTLALVSGGSLCQLMDVQTSCPQCSPAITESTTVSTTNSCYKVDPTDPTVEMLRDCARAGYTPGAATQPSDTPNFNSFYNLTKSEQAARCALKATGGNPFALRQPCISMQSGGSIPGACNA